MFCNILIAANTLCLVAILTICFIFRVQLRTAIVIATKLASNYSAKTGKESVHSLLLKDMDNLVESPPPNNYGGESKIVDGGSTNVKREGISLKRRKPKNTK